MTATPDKDGNVTRPQTPPGQPYTPNPPRPQVYYGTKQGDQKPGTPPRRP